MPFPSPKFFKINLFFPYLPPQLFCPRASLFPHIVSVHLNTLTFVTMQIIHTILSHLIIHRAMKLNLDYPHAYPIIPWLRIIPYYPHANLYHIIPMQIYTLLSPCKSIPYYPHANLYPIIPMA